MEALLIMATAFICVCCFIIGAKVGQMSAKGESIELPNPVKAHRERVARKEAQAEQDRVTTILQNIDNYDGTSNYQQDVPRG